MSWHEQFAEDLALYALAALEGQERAGLEQHLAECAACRLELEQLRGDGALLALSAAGPKPPARARQRLLDAVAKEPRTAFPALAQNTRQDVAASPERSRLSWWGILGWAAAVAVLVFATSLWRENTELKREVFTWPRASWTADFGIGRRGKICRDDYES
jgi:anti-sigma factor RsiW